MAQVNHAQTARPCGLFDAFFNEPLQVRYFFFLIASKALRSSKCMKSLASV
jgi:hypothetical protein